MGPLDNIVVLDLSRILAGPFSTQILSDLGATVWKIESPWGDDTRKWGPPFIEGESAYYLSANRGKKSMIVNLRDERGQAIIKQMAQKADILVENFKVGDLARRGLDYDSVSKINPRLIYASVTGYGSRGPLKERPGYDPLIQAYTGVMSLTGHPDGPPARVGGSVVDVGTGILTALGILAALRERDKTGKGTHVEASLLATSLGWVSYHIQGYLASGEVPGRMGTGLASIAPYEAFRTEDGELMISAGNDGIFSRLCQSLGLAELLDDERFRDNPTRVANRDAVHALIEVKTARMSTEELRALLDEHRVPCAPIRDVSEVVDDEQVRANELLEPVEHPRIPGYRDVAFPLQFDGVRPGTRSVPPMAGEHTAEVLAELGYSEQEVASITAGD